MHKMSLLAAGLFALTAIRGCESSDPTTRCQGVDLSDRSVDPFGGGHQATVLVFVDCDCPISNRYVPTLRSLNEQYAEKSVRFWLVYPDPDVSAQRIERHLQDYDPRIAVLRDPRHELVQTACVTTVPEAAVFVWKDGQRFLSYHGSIDDRFVDFGVARPRATKHHLRDVLELILAGRMEAFPTLRAIGCPIPRMQ